MLVSTGTPVVATRSTTRRKGIGEVLGRYWGGSQEVQEQFWGGGVEERREVLGEWGHFSFIHDPMVSITKDTESSASL